MTTKKGNSKEEDFKRYLDGEMTPAERNQFERKLQKDPFEAEAMEGFEAVQSANFEKDLNALKEKIAPVKRRKMMHYWAAAASVILLLSAGLIWIQVSKQNLVQELTESKSTFKEDDSAQEPVLQKNATMEKEEAKSSESLTMEKATADQSESDKQEQKSEPENFILDADVNEREQAASPAPTNLAETKSIKSSAKNESIIDTAAKPEMAKSRSIPRKQDYRVIKGKIVSADDNSPIPGATVVQKGTENGIVSDQEGNFEIKLVNDSNSAIEASYVGMETAEFLPQADSSNIISLESSQVAMGEVVVTGYESQRKRALTSSSVTVDKTAAKNSDAKPISGWEAYNVYLDENATLPKDYSEKKIVVKLKLELDHDGGIISIVNQNKVDAQIFEKAKELVLDGPEWVPEFKWGENLASNVKLKIVFRKRE